VSPPDPVTERLQRCYASAVHDVMRDLGLRDVVLPRALAPLDPASRLCGPVFTMSGRVDRDAGEHETLLGWTGFLSRAPAGHVVVCQPNDDRVAHMGELSAQTLKLRGVRGYVVDGGCRDVALCLEVGLPIWCRYVTPLDVTGYWIPDAFQVPVTIGDVTVSPGDYLVADRDGVCIIPATRVGEVLDAAQAAVSTENAMRAAIRAGMDPQEAYLEHGKF
jgi:regulator of RNase E activity RraA